MATGALAFTAQAFLSRYLFWDSYFGLVAGRYIAASGIPTAEVLTTAGKSQWVDQQWLAHWLFFSAWELGGYAATALLSAASVTLAFALLAALMIGRGVPGQRAMLWSLVALIVAFGSTVVRAQSLALPFGVLLLWAIVDDHDRPVSGHRVRLMLAVPLLAVWANLHGSVLLGAGALAVYALWRLITAARQRAWRSTSVYATTAVLAAAAPLATPYGLTIIDYYRSLLANSAVHRFILEWSPPQLGNPYSLAFFVVLGATSVVIGYSFARGYRPPMALIVAAAGLGILALTGVRYAVWFAMVAVVLNADVLAHTRPVPVPFPTPFLRAGAAALLVVSLAAGSLLLTTSDADFERDLPRGVMSAVADYGASNPSAGVLADELASALLWRHPSLAGRVAFDTRLEQYSEAALVEWFEFLNGVPPGWPSAADEYEVVIVSAVERPDLVARLAAQPEWAILHAEPNGAAFVRRLP